MHKYDFQLAKLKWNFYVQGDQPGKLLARRVKQLQAKSRIPYIFSSSKEKIYDPQAIANLFVHYYQDLYNIQTSDPAHPFLPEKNGSILI